MDKVTEALDKFMGNRMLGAGTARLDRVGPQRKILADKDVVIVGRTGKEQVAIER